MSILGFEPDDRVRAMINDVELLSPRRPLVFQEISGRHHAIGGAEVFQNDIRISLRPAHIDNRLLSHELGHVLAELQHPHLVIDDRIPRGTPDRRMIGTLLSMFEHPTVYEIQSEYGFDMVEEFEPKMAEYVADFQRLSPEPQTNVYIEKIQGYVELGFVLPADRRWPEIDREFSRIAPRSYTNAQKIRSDVMTHDRVRRHAYKEMLDALIVALDLQRATWPALIHVCPPARTNVRNSSERLAATRSFSEKNCAFR